MSDNASRTLDATYLKDKFQLASEEVELKEVFRQQEASGVMEAATRIRKSITAGVFIDFNLRVLEDAGLAEQAARVGAAVRAERRLEVSRIMVAT